MARQNERRRPNSQPIHRDDSAHSEREARRASLVSYLAIAILLASSASVEAGYQNQTITGGSPGLPAAVELNATSKAIPEVDRAIKIFESREFDASLKLLIEVVKKHPELSPANVLFAKLAFQGNQGNLIRPALERAALESRAHPEV